MGKNLRFGSKKPKNLDMLRQSATLPPLPKMYQMGITKGAQQECERIIKLLESNSECKLPEHDYNGGCYCDTIALIKGETE